MPKVNGFGMKNGFLVVAGLLVFASCTNDERSTQQKIDSLEQKIDTTLEKVSDSISAKAKVLKEKIKDKWENRKDSANRHDSLTIDSTKK